MKILNRLSYFNKPATVTVDGDVARVKAYQIVVWVSISPRERREWDSRTPHFPAILDTGHNHNFSIHRVQLTRWAGILPDLLGRLGPISLHGRRLPLHAATVWLHPNIPWNKGHQRT